MRSITLEALLEPLDRNQLRDLTAASGRTA